MLTFDSLKFPDSFFPRPGDHLEAASPIEASFWPIPPTLDRLLQYKDLVDPFTDKDWDLSATLGDDYRVCGSPNPDVDCLGHHAGDLTYWASVSLDEATGGYVKSYLTNQEVQAAALPRSSKYALPYIYDHFRWDHCSDVGVDFKSV